MTTEVVEKNRASPASTDAQRDSTKGQERDAPASAAADTAKPAAARRFSLDLEPDQLQIQAWVHDFAESVIRPAAHEWDEREETPWPIIEEAARVGLYSLEFVANAFGDPSGILLPAVLEEVAWGDAGIGLALFGTGLAVAGIMANATTEQAGEWL